MLTREQAGAELCQAQAQVSFPPEADLNLTVEFQISVLLEKTYTYIYLYFADFQLLRSSPIEDVFHGSSLPFFIIFQIV